MEMKEIRLSDYKSDKKIIVSLNSNEFCFFVKSKNNENIRGFFTAGIATCSVIIISINSLCSHWLWASATYYEEVFFGVSYPGSSKD